MIELDEVEISYLRAQNQAIAKGDNDWAMNMAAGLQEYRRFYRVPAKPVEEVKNG